MTQTQGQVTPERITQFAFGFAPPLILEAALKHGVFDLLDSGPRTLGQVAEETGASARGLRAILNALVGLGLLNQEEGRYSLTPESSTFLVSGRPSFQGGLLKHTSEQLLPAWMQLTEIVRTGKPARNVNEEETGGEFFREFVEDIFPMSYPAARALGEALGLAEARDTVRVLDLAAGSGVWGIALAQTSPRVQVTAVDWPEVLPVTRRVADRFGVADHFSWREGDLQRTEFGTGYHVATLGHIIHSEGERASRLLLHKVHDALAPGGTIAIAEMVPDPDRRGPAHALIFAVNMLVNTDEGDTYSFEEMSDWLKEAGFVEPRTLDAPGPSPLILARKPNG